MKKEFSRVFLKDASGDVLVIRDRKAVWNIPGGKKEQGESSIACAIREVEEEISLTISDLEEVYSDDFVFGDIEWRGHFYFANTAKGLPTLNEPNKIKGIQFIETLDMVNFSYVLNPLLSYSDKHNILDAKTTKWV